MRSRPRGRRRKIDKGTCGPGLQPRTRFTPGRRRCGRKPKAPSGAPKSRGAPESRAVRDPVHGRRRLARELVHRHPVIANVSTHPPALAVFRFRVAWLWHARCRGGTRTAASFGIACGASALAGCLCLLPVIPVLCGARALSPKARAGCGKAARPSPWRGL